jgi:ribosomal protein S18 acetylase RimI-like enzyme
VAVSLRRIDAYLDAVPRSDTDVENVGPFVLFKGRSGRPYYARPRHGLREEITAADVERLSRRCEALRLALEIEWVGELVPSLESAADAFGLAIERYALLVMPSEALHPAPGEDAVEFPDADDPRLPATRAVADIAFATGGTELGPAGVQERDALAATLADAVVKRLRGRIADGLSITALIADGDEGVVATGAAQPVGELAEIVGVATLPAYRRRGFGAAITSALVAECRRRGVRTVLLSAQSDAVARLYERLGFRRVGSSLAASRG